MKVRFKKLNPDAVVPTKAHATDAAFDLTATTRSLDDYGNVVYGTGIAVEIPHGYVGLVFPRSSVAKKRLILSNGVGVIDSDYRGEIMLKFKPTLATAEKNLGTYDFIYHPYERIGQLMIVPYPDIEFEEVEELTQTERGDGGYGSTGK